MYYFFFQDRQGCKFITASVVLSIRLCMNICAGKIDEFVLCRTSPWLDQFKTGRGMKTILFLMTIAFFNLRPSDLIEINQFLGIISLVFLHQIQIQPSFNIFSIVDHVTFPRLLFPVHGAKTIHGTLRK